MSNRGSTVIAFWFIGLLGACGPGAGDGATPCAQAEDCAAGQICATSGECLPTGSCAADPDCGAAEFCAAGACAPRPRCSAPDAPGCPAGSWCSAIGDCITDGTCALDADCGVDQCSVTGVCTPVGVCLDHGDCDEFEVCDAGTCVFGGACGDFSLPITFTPPDFAIALDRSCSMKDAASADGPSKWAVAADALTQLTGDFDGNLRFGLTLFPDTTAPACGQVDVAVPIGDATAGPIAALLAAAAGTDDANYPDGPCVTNIDSAMAQVAELPALAEPTRPHYAMLVTDGKQAGCEVDGGDAGTEATIAAMLAAGVRTYVVGFGDAVDAPQLARLALAGGGALPDAPYYYQADDAVGLAAALHAIAAAAVPCTVAVPTAPDDLDVGQLHVFFDQVTELPHDPTMTDGWTYDAASKTLTFVGATCATLQAGGVTEVDAIYACPGID